MSSYVNLFLFAMAFGYLLGKGYGPQMLEVVMLPFKLLKK